MNVSGVSQREIINVSLDDDRGLLIGLQLGNPQCGLRNRHGEIVDLDSVELTAANFDRRRVNVLEAHDILVEIEMR